ncbi:MAG: 1-acyl-sn-glycerol-3-phosphate acyltransferase [Bacteriovoracaceae bacterium]|nr:1-acyl-sn-glycerol-3-phosphate acyltransferase [Bacteriovoracaceae bacterium]
MMLSHLRAITRFTAVFTTILLYLLLHSVLFLILSEKKRNTLIIQNTQLAAKLVLKILNIQLTAPLPEIHGKMVVCNHLSYVDVLLIFAYVPGRFITSVEIKETFLLGQITQLASCFFVERRKSKRIPEVLKNEMLSMQQTLKSGFNVILFPEGTSSNGETVLPFKSTLFQVAIDSQIPIQPLTLKYLIDPRDQDSVYWYGDMTFADHLYRLCLLKEVKAHITALGAIEPNQERSILAKIAHSNILESYA